MTYKSKKEYKAAIADLLDSIRDIEEAVYEDYLDDDDDLESNWEESDSSWSISLYYQYRPQVS